MKNKSNWLSLLAACALLLGLFVGCGETTEQSNTAGTAGQSEKPEVIQTALEEMTPAKDYDEISTLFAQIAESYTGVQDGSEGSGTHQDYTQVAPIAAGVEQGSAAKSDGQYLYLLGNSSLLIVRADGANTATVSETSIDQVQNTDTMYSYLVELYVTENRVSVIMSADAWGTDESGAWYDNVTVHVLTYDTTDKTAPVLLSDVAQDGNYVASYMVNGTVYLVSCKNVYDLESQTDMQKAAPVVYDNSGGTTVAAEHIYLCAAPGSASFTVVSAVDAAAGVRLDTQVLTDAVDTVYMHQDGLYLARTVGVDNQSEAYTDGAYTVVDHHTQYQTEISYWQLADGSLSLIRSGLVEGQLVSAGAIDAYQDQLRLVTQSYNAVYSVYTDTQHGWENYDWQQEDQSAYLQVVDQDFQQVSCQSLAEEGEILGAWFVENMAYLAADIDGDTVFTVDLSGQTPAVGAAVESAALPRLLTAYGNGLVLGAGTMTNENGELLGLRFAMTDISSPGSAKLLNQTDVAGASAAAIDGGIVVSAEKGIVAFPTEENAYVAYTFENNAFVQKGRVELSYLAANTQGVLVGDMLYICSDAELYVVELSGFTMVTEITFAAG